MDLLYAHSTDGGLNWTDPAPLNTNASTDAGRDLLLRISTDGASNWIAMWLSRDDLGGTIGTDSDVLFTRFQIGGNENITLCHVPAGNPNNAHTITVSENAVPAHLGHGDSCGPCEEGGGGPQDEGGDGESEASACPADVDGDGAVGAADLTALLAAWGACAGCPADFDGDGQVGPTDLGGVLSAWGMCP